MKNKTKTVTRFADEVAKGTMKVLTEPNEIIALMKTMKKDGYDKDSPRSTNIYNEDLKYSDITYSQIY